MKIFGRFALVAAAALVAGCEGETISSPADDPGPLRLAIVSGNTQVGPEGQELPAPLVASVVDSKGRPIPAQLVNFRVVSGGGSMFAGSTISDKLGIAKDYWTLGLTGPQSVEVRAVDPSTGAKFVYATFTATFPAAPPPQPPPPSDLDGDGFSVDQGDCNDGDAAIKPGASDDPDAAFVDTNCDGIDGTKTASVFVSQLGFNGPNCGEFTSPCQTITHGITRALSMQRSRVLIGGGIYVEAVVLRDGVNLHGGYNSDFTARSLSNRAWISGSAEYPSIGVMYTVLGEGLTLPTLVDMLQVMGAVVSDRRADGSGKHSVALFLKNVASGVVTISSTKIQGGQGASGLGGIAGANASQIAGAAGGNGQNSDETEVACDGTSFGAGGNGSGSGFVEGGNGGAGGRKDTDCPFSFAATPGIAGLDAVFSTAAYGNGGAGGAVCTPGEIGQDGTRGVDGANGTGGGPPSIVSGVLTTGSGTNGGVGAPGTGGGGGGGSGGCDDGIDSYGAGGGGGGSGGFHSTVAGAAGKGGGASVAVYLSAANPTFANVEIIRGIGGAGGAGGAGGRGQPGSAGGNGGLGFGTGAGGAGGDGGDGGFSGGGGGGSGGLSVGILKTLGSVTVDTSVSVSGGTAGAGGVGGARGDGTKGSDGGAGSLNTIVVM
jgi:hypothetical protein